MRRSNMDKSIDDKQLKFIELRQYTLHPHKRDVLIDLFDREFAGTQDQLKRDK
jgi:hypothetical protein